MRVGGCWIPVFAVRIIGKCRLNFLNADRTVKLCMGQSGRLSFLGICDHLRILMGCIVDFLLNESVNEASFWK